MRKVILFGGSFDPVHWGHLEIAKQALKQTGASELWFLLAAQNPFKKDTTPYYHRRKMLSMMIDYHHKLKICDIENHLPKPSYSIDTVRALKKQHPNTHFYWLIGSDQIPKLHEWKDFDRLKQTVEFLVYTRPGENHSHDYQQITGKHLDISSTDIRHGKSKNTKASILNYMMCHNLYTEKIIQNRVSDFRYQHSLRVQDLALEIGKCHHLDENKIKLSTLMHDYSKEDSKKDLQTAMPQQYLNLHPALYHGFVAAQVLSKSYYVKDKDVLRAIRSHVNGKGTNPYAMLLYIADKCEPGRNYPSQELIALAKKDLVKGFKKVKEENEKFLKETV